MPTVMRVGPYRLYFYGHDLVQEPPHIHVDRDDNTAKFLLSPVSLARNLGFKASELRKIERIVSSNAENLMERWNEEYGSASG